MSKLVSVLLLLVPLGCLWPVNVPEPFLARGTWEGTAEPVLLESSQHAFRVTGIRLEIVRGPALRQQTHSGAVSTVGWSAILVDEHYQVLPWPIEISGRRSARVTGHWDSSKQHALWKGVPLLQPEAPRQACDVYNVIVGTQFEVE